MLFNEPFRTYRNQQEKYMYLEQSYKLMENIFFVYLSFSTCNLSFQDSSNLENDLIFDIYSCFIMPLSAFHSRQSIYSTNYFINFYEIH
jgi:hypothetical protein